MDGEVWLGPNAVLALAREGYSATDFNWEDFKEILRFRYMYISTVVAKKWRSAVYNIAFSVYFTA